VGEGCVLYPGVYVGAGAVLGQRCVIFPNVTIYEAVRVGNDVRIHAGSVLGSDGFGYAPRTRLGADGKPEVTGHQKIYHLGGVVIGDGVEIGALTCIDRGTIEDTVVEKSAKIDNQVHLGHNSRVGEGAVVCGATALAGNASIGAWAYVGGLVGITNHVHVGERAKVAALSLLSKDVPAGVTVSGNPQREHSEYLKVNAMLSRLLKDKKKNQGEKS
jgi:UDP-3-O-[3-hydroxymyristoyl] glucosamine N-acyltransferase